MSRIPRSLAVAVLLAGALSLAGSTAFAASGGGGGSSGGGSSGGSSGGGSSSGGSGGGSAGPAPIKCNKGWTYDASKGWCVRNTSLNDKQLYEAGRTLALAGNYENALDSLNAIRDKNDAMVLTMIGYSERKSGNYDTGLAYYAKALAIEPMNVNTHEYLGEAYAEKGQIDLAKAELAKVEAVCGTTCEQYQDLAKAIAGEPDES